MTAAAADRQIAQADLGFSPGPLCGVTVLGVGIEWPELPAAWRHRASYEGPAATDIPSG
jgi:hypothetical protein